MNPVTIERDVLTETKIGVKRMGPGAGFPDAFPCGCAYSSAYSSRPMMLVMENGDRLCACGKRWRGVWVEAHGPAPDRYPRWGVRRLRSLPTLSSAQSMDLKLETHGFRYWVSRLTDKDGETAGVYVEKFLDGKWTEFDRYGDAPKNKGRKKTETQG